jgi:hypothetical protein
MLSFLCCAYVSVAIVACDRSGYVISLLLSPRKFVRCFVFSSFFGHVSHKIQVMLSVPQSFSSSHVSVLVRWHRGILSQFWCPAAIAFAKNVVGTVPCLRGVRSSFHSHLVQTTFSVFVISCLLFCIAINMVFVCIIFVRWCRSFVSVGDCALVVARSGVFRNCYR